MREQPVVVRIISDQVNRGPVLQPAEQRESHRVGNPMLVFPGEALIATQQANPKDRIGFDWRAEHNLHVGRLKTGTLGEIVHACSVTFVITQSSLGCKQQQPRIP